MDNRRSRWIAFDAFFFHDDLGMELRERFGPAGVMLFIGFLCACKRNPIPGQITYATEPEAMVLLGCQGLALVNEKGESYDLVTFWTYLGHRKQTRRTRRGRLQNVISTKWGKWQQEYGRQAEAERKRRSRPRNRPDDVPPFDGQSTADAPPLGVTDNDLDLDPDNDITPLPPQSGGEGVGSRRAEGNNPRANGTNPRATTAARARNHAAQSHGENLAAMPITDAELVEMIDQAYREDPQRRELALSAARAARARASA